MYRGGGDHRESIGPSLANERVYLVWFLILGGTFFANFQKLKKSLGKARNVTEI
jgi:hypothetical protein